MSLVAIHIFLVKCLIQSFKVLYILVHEGICFLSPKLCSNIFGLSGVLFLYEFFFKYIY